VSLSSEKKNGRANFSKINIASINLANPGAVNYFDAARAQNRRAVIRGEREKNGKAPQAEVLVF
jgi:hypothetical protein